MRGGTVVGGRDGTHDAPRSGRRHCLRMPPPAGRGRTHSLDAAPDDRLRFDDNPHLKGQRRDVRRLFPAFLNGLLKRFPGAVGTRMRRMACLQEMRRYRETCDAVVRSP